VTAFLGGELVGPDASIEGASIDSRTIRPGQLYVPIVAERDGHAFIAAALEAGAPAYLTAQEPDGGTAIRVRDTAASLLNLGAFARGRVGGAIGITGSVGKTTTKDLLAGCLASRFRIGANEGSFNNELGLPLTLLNAPDGARWVVLEMGARGAGQIERLAEVARPDVGIVTRVAMAHLEYFGDLDGVARAKSELVAALPASGLAVLNFNDPRVRDMASVSACPVMGYAVGADAEVRADDITLDRDLRARFRLSSPWGQAEVRLAVHGVHQVANALAATTVALWCGVPIETVVATLAVSQGSPLRMEVHHVPGGPVLVVDCYNANPASAEVALRSLAVLSGERKVAVLGLMAELGDQTESEHRRIALMAKELGIEVMGYATEFYGEPPVTSVDEAVALLRTLGPTDAVLIKGSRVARLEDVVRAYGEASDAPWIEPISPLGGSAASSPTTDLVAGLGPIGRGGCGPLHVDQIVCPR
jgi:UDP-N-acetylmuramoyl-tripeptide--D-alanyl-D-alanine ligase